jgi:hypothetical protein
MRLHNMKLKRLHRMVYSPITFMSQPDTMLCKNHLNTEAGCPAGNLHLFMERVKEGIIKKQKF